MAATNTSTGTAPWQPSRTPTRPSRWLPVVEIGWTRRSPRSPSTATSPRWCAGWGACADLDLTAFALAVEIGDWDRFTAASIGAYLGLVPSEHSSGASRSQGGITKTGNSHARRLLVEAAWHYRNTYRPTVVLRRRWEVATPRGPGP